MNYPSPKDFEIKQKQHNDAWLQNYDRNVNHISESVQFGIILAAWPFLSIALDQRRPIRPRDDKRENGILFLCGLFFTITVIPCATIGFVIGLIKQIYFSIYWSC